jgi:hypothetical protein
MGKVIAFPVRKPPREGWTPEQRSVLQRLWEYYGDPARPLTIVKPDAAAQNRDLKRRR